MIDHNQLTHNAAHFGPIGFLLSGVGFIMLGAHHAANAVQAAQASGIDWVAVGAVLSGTALLIQAVVASSREIRAWLDRRAAKGAAVALPHFERSR